MSRKIKKITYLGLYTAVAILLGYIESLLPVITAVPGMKIGLANLAIVLVLYQFGPLAAFMVQIVRILAVGFLFGNLFGIAFSLAGGMSSLIVMTLIKHQTVFGITGVSVAGGVTHNIGQILIASALVKNNQIMYYLPALIVTGVTTGLLIGLLCMEIRKRLYKYD
ncbi:Gx transporter family protein [Blautia liquoris]|uniref:Gx transporter family protein n=1 Tax=Blautia liquoris TaxID=2779518 RepID=A0A7M2RKK2_9FIRM|nr:Gx transporter family protein [Blautia liquoris]QOV20775.1 Gx transporter family protein [Blautia liquoris]